MGKNLRVFASPLYLLLLNEKMIFGMGLREKGGIPFSLDFSMIGKWRRETGSFVILVKYLWLMC